MTKQDNPQIYFASAPRKSTSGNVSGEYISILGEDYYCIRNYDRLEHFFMTLVSSSNHWLFISSSGGLTAGRVNANYALFPYYTVDKITENSENTGSKTILRLQTDAGIALWEPFSERFDGVYPVERNLYKNIAGTALIFEEINHDLGLIYRYAWRTGDRSGFVKTAFLINLHDTPREVDILDGLQNVLPAHVTADVQNQLSNLLDAYKLNELHEQTGTGIYTLSSRLTDIAEPSESLRANTVWQVGLQNVTYLLSSSQLTNFRRGEPVTQETQTRGMRGAYFVSTQLSLAPEAELTWHLVAEVNLDTSDVATLIASLSDNPETLIDELEDDIQQGQKNLETIVGRADGLQVSEDRLSTAHHYANVLYNVMRGGTFVNHYHIDVDDLKRFIHVHRPSLLQTAANFFDSLPASLTVSELRERVDAEPETDLVRLCYAYLPLTFSRRHGDPSRPWNRFEINVKDVDGSGKLDYQGNWRDIFQNWEALSLSYPEFIDGMIGVFLNATTVDGYNPYRLTRHGIDWEVPEPDNAWANIGYWGDHQIIYLQKLLEVCKVFFPERLQTMLTRQVYSCANVPYLIKPYEQILQNPYDTIDFDWDKDTHAGSLVSQIGADGKLVQNAEGGVYHVTMGEKLLLLLLTKLVNFVPEGGIWLNTQRPEWNDANNALVGKGMSVVTLCYIRRYITFFVGLLTETTRESLSISSEVATLWRSINQTLTQHQPTLQGAMSDTQRRTIMDALGEAGSAYRWQFYENGVSNSFEEVSAGSLLDFLNVAQQYVEHSLHANRRKDSLYHSYNILHLSEDSARVSYLPVMLEGQVAILSSGLLSADEALELLHALRQSALYREDQHSYMLYPNREVAGFLERNHVPAQSVQDLELVAMMQERGDRRLLAVDANGVYHFHGDIRNADDVQQILATLGQESSYADLVSSESERILYLFEQVFNHAEFTGRSSTFFAYEGLGSIYWHMISKLLLAVQETVLHAAEMDVPDQTLQALIETYDDVRAGIGFNKSPAVYGAFPTDPYSHTPLGKGAKQPGMTGMVKEEILTRFIEVGLSVEAGNIVFQPMLLRKMEMLDSQTHLKYVDIHGTSTSIDVPDGALAFTFCQVPFLILQSDVPEITVHYADGTTARIDGTRLGTEDSQHIFSRSGNVRQVTIAF